MTSSVDALLTKSGLSVAVVAGLLDTRLRQVPAVFSAAGARSESDAAEAIIALAPAARILSVQAVAAANHAAASTVRRWVAEGRLVAFTVGRRLQLPAFQFDDRGALLPGIGQILAKARPLWSLPMIASFLDTPQAELDVAGEALTPRCWLLGGNDPAAVLDLIDITW